MKKLVIGLAVALMSAMFVLPAYGIGKCEVDGPNLLPGWNGRAQVGCDEANYKGIWIQNTIKAEGMTDNAYETLIYITEPTADRTIAVPNASGTVMLQSSTGLAMTGTDGKILIYNAATSSFDAQEVSGDVTITNAGVASIGSEKVTTAKILNGADGRLLISTDASSGSVGWQAMSGDVTITNAGAATIGASAITTSKINANAVTATKVYINSTTVTVAGGAVYNTEAVPVGSLMTGYAPSININGTAFANNVFITSGLAVVCTTDMPAHYQQYKVYYVMP